MKTIFFLEKICDRNFHLKDDALFNISLNHNLFGSIKGYDEGVFEPKGNLIFEYRNQPGVALRSSRIESILEMDGKITVTTRNSVYVFRKTNLQ